MAPTYKRPQVIDDRSYSSGPSTLDTPRKPPSKCGHDLYDRLSEIVFEPREEKMARLSHHRRMSQQDADLVAEAIGLSQSDVTNSTLTISDQQLQIIADRIAEKINQPSEASVNVVRQPSTKTAGLTNHIAIEALRTIATDESLHHGFEQRALRDIAQKALDDMDI